MKFPAIPLAKLAQDVTPPAEDAWDLFPVGQRVRVIRSGVDFVFFRGDETGTVIRNGHRYLSIIVEFDVPFRYLDDRRPEGYWDRTEHGFNPDDLLPIPDRRRKGSDR